MNIKSLWENKIFKTACVGVGAALVLSYIFGAIIGQAIFWGSLAGAGYLAYQYLLKPFLSERKSQADKAQLRKYNSHYYDKNEVDRKVKEVMKSRGRG